MKKRHKQPLLNENDFVFVNGEMAVCISNTKFDYIFYKNKKEFKMKNTRTLMLRKEW